MSSSSPQEKAAGTQAQTQATLAGELSGIAIPELQRLIGPGGTITNQLASTSNGTIKSSWDQAAYDAANSKLTSAYGQAGFGNKEAISYGGLRSGEGRSSNVMGSALGSAATSLMRDESMARSNLDFMSASSSLNDYNRFLSAMGQGTNTAMGLASGSSGAANSAISMMSGNSQMGGTLGGAASGAALGTSILPGWGTAIGGIVGGAAGYLGSG